MPPSSRALDYDQSIRNGLSGRKGSKISQLTPELPRMSCSILPEIASGTVLIQPITSPAFDRADNEISLQAAE
jgi:hypothetical protein